MTPPPDNDDLVGDEYHAPDPLDPSSHLLSCPNCRTPQQVNPVMASTTCVSCNKVIRAIECDNCHRVFTTVKSRRFQCPQCLHTIKGGEARTVPFQRLEAEPPPYVPSEETVENAGILGGLRRTPLRGMDRWLVVAAAAAAVIALILGLVVTLSNNNNHADGSPSAATTTTQSPFASTTTLPPVATTTSPPAPTTTTTLAPVATTTSTPAPTTTTTRPPTTTTTTSCNVGSPTSTISIESANQNPITGFYAVTVGGVVSNSANGTVRDVVVHWSISYASGTTDSSEATLVGGGGTISHGASLSWSAQPARSGGSDQPTSASVLSVTFQFAC